MSFNYAYPKNMTDLSKVCPVLLWIFSEMAMYCSKRNLPLSITSVIRGMIPGVSVSNSHEQGRALDLSTKGWTTDDIDDFVFHFNKLYADLYGAIALSNHVPRVAVHHEGTGWHLHLQVRPLQIDMYP